MRKRKPLQTSMNIAKSEIIKIILSLRIQDMNFTPRSVIEAKKELEKRMNPNFHSSRNKS